MIIAVVRAFTAVSPRDLEQAHHLDGAVRGLGNRRRLAGQHRAGGGLGVDGVGLAGGAAQAPVASIHFRDTMPGVANGPRQAGAIAAGAFDAEGLDPSVGVRPRQQGPIAACIRDERLTAQADAPGVDHHRDVDMLVGIYPDNHRPRLGRRGHAVGHRLASSAVAADWPGWADRTVTSRGCSRPLLGHGPSGQLAAVQVAGGR